jgi:transglutaminase-like putative cysteine protease
MSTVQKNTAPANAMPASAESWRLAIEHETVVEYGGSAHASYNELRMTPLTLTGQSTLTSSVELDPRTAMWQYTDYWGTRVTTFDLQEPHSALTIRAASTVETNIAAPGRPVPDRASADWSDISRKIASGDLSEFVTPTGLTTINPELEHRARERAEGAGPHEAAEEIVGWLNDSVAYVPGSTGVHTNAQEAWDKESGVCQDFSHLAIGLLRAAGLPARYVSGYLFPDPEAVPGVTAEGQSHAWVEYWAGAWTGIDATNRTTPGPRHVIVGHGRDYRDVLPHKGIYHGAPGSTLTVSVRFTRLA